MQKHALQYSKENKAIDAQGYPLMELCSNLDHAEYFTAANSYNLSDSMAGGVRYVMFNCIRFGTWLTR